MQQYFTIRDRPRGTRQDCTGAPCTDEWIRRRGGEGCEHPGIATGDLTHQYFNQSGILFIFTLELLDTQGNLFFFFSPKSGIKCVLR